MKGEKNETKRLTALALAAIMAVSFVPASAVSAKTKYKTVKEDGKNILSLALMSRTVILRTERTHRVGNIG